MKTNKNWKDVVQRAWRTFWQASISYLIVNINIIADAITTDIESGGFETLKSVGLTIGVGALAAGLSALYNGVLKDLFTPTYIENTTDEDEMGFAPALEEAEEDEIEAEVIAENYEAEDESDDGIEAGEDESDISTEAE